LSTADFAAGTFVCTSGETQGDIFRLYGESAALTLKKHGDSFLFVSHQRAVGESNIGDNKMAAEFVKSEIKGFDPSEYTIFEIQQIGGYIIAAVNVIPEMGQGSVRIYAMKYENDELSIINEASGDHPISLEVAVYKIKTACIPFPFRPENSKPFWSRRFLSRI